MARRLGIKRSGVIIVSIMVLIMLLFPPWQKVGVWREWNTGNVANGSLNRSLNRWYFGYIPEYRPIWSQPVYKDIMRIDPFYKYSSGFRRGLKSGEEYELIATQYTFDWLIILIQLTLAIPFLWLDTSNTKKKLP